MDWHERIVTDQKILVGKPVIKGTRLAVEFIVDLLTKDGAKHKSWKLPGITREDILACPNMLAIFSSLNGCIRSRCNRAHSGERELPRPGRRGSPRARPRRRMGAHRHAGRVG